MSSIKCISNSAAKSIDYNRSSSKRLYQFVFKIIDHDEMQISSFDQYQTNGSKITNLLNNQSFIENLHHKIKAQGLYDSYPILKVTCKKLGEQGKTLYTLDVQDLVSVFEKFGKLYKIYITSQEKVCYIFFKSFFNAFVAMKLLNSINLRSVPSQLCVEWCPTNQYEKISCYFGHYYENVQWPQPQYPQNQNQGNCNNSNLNNQCPKQNKLTCRYNIQIQNQKQFQVARRIIGAKGTNMKKIIQTAIEQIQDGLSGNMNQLLKLRLRGKGSGYKQGPEQVQSDQSLHLCISAKDQRIYNFACQSVEKLLKNVYLEYQEFTKKQGCAIILQVKKIDISPQQNTGNQGNQGTLKTIQTNIGRLQADKIQQLLEMRNKARRELNFSQADRIRNYLRSCGVCLIDQKGRRGKATEVTTWKYLI